AIAARSYAWVNRGRHHDQGVDFCDTTHCQFYSGIPRQEATRTAVARTAGLILTRAGVPVEVYFHSTCGGHTAAAGTTFGEQTPPHLSGVSDGDDCQSSPHAHWRWQVDAETLLAAIRELYGPDITGWEVGASDPAGRVLDIRLVSERGAPVEVRAEDWRMAMTRRFGWQTLKSTLFAVHREGPDWVFRGRGLGHGVGLCQWGAFGMARRGESMEAILAHYFPGTEVSRWDRLPRQGTPDDDPEAILARALARIGTEWEAPPLDRPTIRVAASTAEFSRRSGARPFAAGRYLRGTIHLQPLDLLRRRGILERTIVHEAAHFCLERLAGPACPRWLAEGLAGRMAGTDEGTDEAEGSPPAVAEIDRGLRSPFWTEAETAARQATVLVGRLIDTAGMPRLIATLRAQRRGDPGPLQELARAAGLSGF
ncbi:MAG TPA: SpoIID/LytB domain-containing protein, partial [Candidatus Aminicenantes bacterium]|nr:SpoIID/LytB domain-containing protein [Candidatus Aminicenantes bacterium]